MIKNLKLSHPRSRLTPASSRPTASSNDRQNLVQRHLDLPKIRKQQTIKKMSDQHSRLPSRSRVNVRSTLTVVSSRPTDPRTMAHPLSVLDHAMGNHSLHIVFYYRNRKGGLDFERLRPSLCEVLSMYPMVTGRLRKDGNGNWKVRWNDAGVRVLRANVVGVGMDEWLTSADFEEEMDLTVWDDLPDDDPHIWSPFRIQITEFERGGLAIGLSCTHLQADPTCATLLINSWTEYHRREASLSHPPSIHPAPALQPRPNPNLDTESAQFYASKSKASGFTAATPQPQFKKMSTATFSFSDSSIRNSLLKINTTNSQTQTNASPFDFLTALFWTRITRVKAERSRDDFDKQYNSLTICKDMRNLLHAPLPYGYFGNALNFTKLSLDVELFIKDGRDVRRVANLVSNHLSGLKEEEFMSAIDWFHSRKDENGKLPPPFRMYGPELTCVSMEHMIAGSSSEDAEIGSKCEPLMYAAKFEKDEKPVHVSYRMGNVGGAQGEEEGFILVMPSPEGGMARRVTVTLPEEEMASLCDDEEIKSLEPTPLICGRK